MTLFGVHAQLDDFQRHLTPDWLFLFRQINHAATAFADFLQQLVTSKPAAELFVGQIIEINPRFLERASRLRVQFGNIHRRPALIKKILGRVVGLQHFLNRRA